MAARTTSWYASFFFEHMQFVCTVIDTCCLHIRWEAQGPENLVLASTNEMLTEAVQHGNKAGQLVAVKFFAPWCQACKALYPKWIQLATQNPDVTFVKVSKHIYRTNELLLLQKTKPASVWNFAGQCC